MPDDIAFLNSLKVRDMSPTISLEGWACDEKIDWYVRNTALTFHDQRLARMKCWLYQDRLAGFITTNMDRLTVQSSEERKELGLDGLSVTEDGTAFIRYPALLIGQLGVCSEFRRKGLARRMVQYAVGQAFESGPGCRFVIVDAVPTEEAVALYKGQGFGELEVPNKRNSSTIEMYLDLGRR